MATNEENALELVRKAGIFRPPPGSRFSWNPAYRPSSARTEGKGAPHSPRALRKGSADCRADWTDGTSSSRSQEKCAPGEKYAPVWQCVVKTAPALGKCARDGHVREHRDFLPLEKRLRGKKNDYKRLLAWKNAYSPPETASYVVILRPQCLHSRRRSRRPPQARRVYSTRKCLQPQRGHSMPRFSSLFGAGSVEAPIYCLLRWMSDSFTRSRLPAVLTSVSGNRTP